jgi:alkylation response protein AidB-like acyl-CoA dehydrogenase
MLREGDGGWGGEGHVSVPIPTIHNQHTAACGTPAAFSNGAYGLLRDYPVKRYLRWAKVTAFLDGTPQIQQLVIARDLLK